MAQTHAQSGQVVSVRPLGEHLKDAKTTAILKAEELEIVRVVLLAGHETTAVALSWCWILLAQHRFASEFRQNLPEQQTLHLKTCSGSLQTRMDPHQLTQVLSNLVQNGLRYSSQCHAQGQVWLDLFRDPDSDLPVLEVLDDVDLLGLGAHAAPGVGGELEDLGHRAVPACARAAG